jgi:phosphohistidine phosphatase SixA
VQEPLGEIPKNRSEQRNLSDEGIRDAALIGVVFRKYNIAFGEIIASPMYRTIETAEMAAAKPTRVTMDLRVYPSTPDQEKLVRTPPKKGTNRLLVTHHFVIETHVPGIKPGDIDEGEAVVVRHLPGGGIELAGRLKLDDWQSLANPGQGKRAVRADAPAIHGGYAAPALPASNIPDTHAGHLAREYIAVFNTGTAGKMRSYIETTMVLDPARPTDARLESYAKLFADLGPLTLVAVDSSAALDVVLSMQSKRGPLKLNVKASEAQPTRVSSVTFTYAQPGGHR